MSESSVAEPPPAAEPLPAAGAPSAAGPPAPRRGMGSSSDMVRSLVLIIAVVGVLLLIVPRPNGRPVARVDVAAAAQNAQAKLGFAPSVPKELPDGWTAQAASVENGTDGLPTWHLTYLTPSGTYAGVQEAAHATQLWENIQVTDGSIHQGTIESAGQTFQVRSRTDRGITSWVLHQSDRTTVITGTADAADLSDFAGAIYG